MPGARFSAKTSAFLTSSLTSSHAFRRLEVDRRGFLVGVEDLEIERIVRRFAIGRGDAPAGIAALRVLDLDDLRAKPGERLGAGRPRLELGQIDNPNAFEAAKRRKISTHPQVSSTTACLAGTAFTNDTAENPPTEIADLREQPCVALGGSRWPPSVRTAGGGGGRRFPTARRQIGGRVWCVRPRLGIWTAQPARSAGNLPPAEIEIAAAPPNRDNERAHFPPDRRPGAWPSGHAGRHRRRKRRDGGAGRRAMGLSAIAAAADPDPGALCGAGADGTAGDPYRARPRRADPRPLRLGLGMAVGAGSGGGHGEFAGHRIHRRRRRRRAVRAGARPDPAARGGGAAGDRGERLLPADGADGPGYRPVRIRLLHRRLGRSPRPRPPRERGRRPAARQSPLPLPHGGGDRDGVQSLDGLLSAVGHGR